MNMRDVTLNPELLGHSSFGLYLKKWLLSTSSWPHVLTVHHRRHSPFTLLLDLLGYTLFEQVPGISPFSIK